MHRFLVGLFLILLLPYSALAAALAPWQGGTGTKSIFSPGRIPVADANGNYSQDADLSFDLVNNILTIGGTTAAPLFSMDPTQTASGTLPYFSAPFLLRAPLSDAHHILLTEYMDITAAANATASTKGGLNINLERTTGVPLGAKGDFYAYSLNITSHQADIDKWSDGVLGYAANITVDGGIRTDGLVIAMVENTTPSVLMRIFHGGITKSIAGTTATENGMEVSCSLIGAATTACNTGMLVWGAWQNGIYVTTLAGSPPWTTGIIIDTVTGTTINTGILFGSGGGTITTGINLNQNSLQFAAGDYIRDNLTNRPMWHFADGQTKTIYFVYPQANTQDNGFVFQASRGTDAARTALGSGDVLTNMYFSGYDGVGNFPGAQLSVVSTAVAATGNAYGDFRFLTRNAGGTMAERLRIEEWGLRIGPIALANFPTSPVNFQIIGCSDCLRGSNPCTSASTGAVAVRINGAWSCLS